MNKQAIFLTPARLQEYTLGHWVLPCPDDLLFTGVGSYRTYHEGDVYFATDIAKWLKDGKDVRKRLSTRITKGVRALVVDHADFATDWSVPVLLVDDALTAFKQATIAVRQALNPFTILITGTEGKTGAKIQLHHLLSSQVSTHAVLNSDNTQVPVFRSLIQLRPDDKVEVNEVSVGSDEAIRLENSQMVNPDLCLFTNIGPNYMDIHKTMENLLFAKSSVVVGMRKGAMCIIDGDNAYADALAQQILLRRDDAQIIRYGSQASDAGQLLSQTFDADRLGWQVSARIDAVFVDYFVPLVQQHAPLASVGVLLAVKNAGFDVSLAAQAYHDLDAYRSMGKLERVALKSGGELLFYDQSSRGDISGMNSAFADLANIPVAGKLVALVGGVSVLYDTHWTKTLHYQLADLINNSPIDVLYTTGSYFGYVNERLTKPVVAHSDDRNELAVRLVNSIEAGDVLFVIGSAYLELNLLAKRVYWLLENGYEGRAPSLPQKSHTYRLLLTYQLIEQGKALPHYASLRQGISFERFKQDRQQSKDFDTLRTQLLSHFFSSLPELIATTLSVRCVDEQIAQTSYRERVVTDDFCRRWFNNLDKRKDIESKSVFGSFFDYGSQDWLLYLAVASSHAHLGLVRCRTTDSGFEPVPLSESDGENGLADWQAKGITQLGYRSWGRGWLSIDLGRVLDLIDLEQFNQLTQLADSRIFQSEVKSFLEALAQ